MENIISIVRDKAAKDGYSTNQALDLLLGSWGLMSIIAKIFSRFALTPCWVIMKIRNFSIIMSNVHLVGFSFIQWRQRFLKVSLRSAM